MRKAARFGAVCGTSNLYPIDPHESSHLSAGPGGFEDSARSLVTAFAWDLAVLAWLALIEAGNAA